MELTRSEQPADTVLDDDLLRLIFTCCHPSLAPDARLALALRTLCQLSVAQVAAAMLTTEAAMAKRLTRTRQKITVARIPYRVPADSRPARAVDGGLRRRPCPLHGGSRPGRRRLRPGCRPVRRGPAAGPTAEPAAAGRGHAGRSAGVGAVDRGPPAGSGREQGDPVPLSVQDRSRWDRSMIEEGSGLLQASLRRTQGIADPYQLQAAIAYEHDRAAPYAATDWTEILRLYDLLLSVAPSAPAALGRAVVLAELDGPEAGLAALATLPVDTRREAVRSELLARAGRPAEAAAAVSAALAGEAPRLSSDIGGNGWPPGRTTLLGLRGRDALVEQGQRGLLIGRCKSAEIDLGVDTRSESCAPGEHRAGPRQPAGARLTTAPTATTTRGDAQFRRRAAGQHGGDPDETV